MNNVNTEADYLSVDVGKIQENKYLPVSHLYHY